jgi:hypothetical protein
MGGALPTGLGGVREHSVMRVSQAGMMDRVLKFGVRRREEKQSKAKSGMIHQKKGGLGRRLINHEKGRTDE